MEKIDDAAMVERAEQASREAPASRELFRELAAAIERLTQPGGDVPGVCFTDDIKDPIRMLIAVARAAEAVLDGNEEGNYINCSELAAVNLSHAIGELETMLPDSKPGYVLSGAAKAEWALHGVLHAQQFYSAWTVARLIAERDAKELGWSAASKTILKLEQQLFDVSEKLGDERDSAREDRDALQGKVKMLRTALENNQWVEYNDPDYGTQRFCPDCRTDKKVGLHHPTCDIGQALAATEPKETL